MSQEDFTGGAPDKGEDNKQLLNYPNLNGASDSVALGQADNMAKVPSIQTGMPAGQSAYDHRHFSKVSASSDFNFSASSEHYCWKQSLGN